MALYENGRNRQTGNLWVPASSRDDLFCVDVSILTAGIRSAADCTEVIYN